MKMHHGVKFVIPFFFLLFPRGQSDVSYALTFPFCLISFLFILFFFSPPPYFNEIVQAFFSPAFFSFDTEKTENRNCFFSPPLKNHPAFSSPFSLPSFFLVYFFRPDRRDRGASTFSLFSPPFPEYLFLPFFFFEERRTYWSFYRDG